MSPSVREADALEVRGARLVWGERTYLMGIVNASPDSFSGDGLAEPAAVLERALEQRAAGADILDLGAESTRPSRLANMAEQHGFAARAIGEPVEALAIARRNGDGDGIVVVTGSTFVVGTLRDWWLTNVAERSRS